MPSGMLRQEVKRDETWKIRITDNNRGRLNHYRKNVANYSNSDILRSRNEECDSLYMFEDGSVG